MKRFSFIAYQGKNQGTLHLHSTWLTLLRICKICNRKKFEVLFSVVWLFGQNVQFARYEPSSILKVAKFSSACPNIRISTRYMGASFKRHGILVGAVFWSTSGEIPIKAISACRNVIKTQISRMFECLLSTSVNKRDYWRYVLNDLNRLHTFSSERGALSSFACLFGSRGGRISLCVSCTAQ